MVELATTIWADGPSSTPYEPQKHQIRSWGSWVESIITAFTSNGGLIYSSLAALNADLSKPANSMAWVMGDPVAANNGVYGKVGASGTGSWTRRADLPFSFIIASNDGSGAPSAIQATTSIPVSPSALVLLEIAEDYSGTSATVSFNGGSVLAIKSNSGEDVQSLSAGSVVYGVVTGGEFRLANDEAIASQIYAARDQAFAARDAAEDARDIALGAAGDTVSQGEVPIFDSRSTAGTYDLSAFPLVTINKWAAGSVYAPARYVKVPQPANGEPSHARKFQDVNGLWFEMLVGPEGINILSLGCTLISSGGADLSAFVYDARPAQASAAASGCLISIPSGTFQFDNNSITTEGTGWLGQGYDTVFELVGESNKPCFWQLANDYSYDGIRFRIDPAVIPEHGGLYSTAITVGRYISPVDYAPIKRGSIGMIRPVWVERFGRVENMTNSICLIGNVDGVEIGEVIGVDGLAVVIGHWGGVGTTHGAAISKTFHPTNINIRGVRGIGTKLWPLFLSACYDVEVDTVDVENCELAVSIQAGDVGNRFAPAAIKDRICSNIHVRNVRGTVVNPVYSPTSSPISLRSTGRYVDDWIRVPFKDVSVDAQLFTTGVTVSDGIARLWDCANSSIDLDLEIITDDVQTRALSIDFSTGFKARLKGNAYQGAFVTGSVGELTLDLSNPKATTTTSGNSGAALFGARYTNTLSAAITDGLTSISYTADMPTRLYRGDILRMSSDPTKVAVVAQDFVPTTARTMTVETIRGWTAASGESFYMDFSIDIDLRGSIDGYPTNIAGRTGSSRHIKRLDISGMQLKRCGRYDVSISNADSFIAHHVKCLRGGTRYPSTAVAATCFDFEAVGNWEVSWSQLGVDSRFYTNGIFFRDGNCYNGIAESNKYGQMLGAEIAGAALSASYNSPDRTNTYSRQRKYAGGAVTPVLT